MYKLADKKIFFSNNIVFNELDYIGCGANSKVYKIKLEGISYALKIFNEPKIWNLKKFERKLDIKISSFVSPLRISYLNKKFNGYVMDFCNGNNLCEQKLNISINQFIEYANKLLSDTDKLSELKYIIQDTSLSNTMFDNGFKIVDIDFYDDEINLFKDIDDIKKFNKRAITGLLIDIFVTNAMLSDLFKKNLELEQLKINCIFGKCSLDKFINMVCNLVFSDREYQKNFLDYSLEDIQQISDSKKLVRKKNLIN